MSRALLVPHRRRRPDPRKTMMSLFWAGAAEKKNNRGPRYEKLHVKSTSGEIIGYVLVNEQSGSLDAHCLKHGGDCRLARTYKAYAGTGRLTPFRASQGRSLSFVVSWLRVWEGERGSEHREAHTDVGKGVGEMGAILRDGGSELRRTTRVYVEEEPTLAPARRVERQPRPGEPLEPPGPF